RVLNADPDLPGGVGIDGLGDIEAEHGAFDQSQPGDVDAETEAEGVGDGAEGMAVDVGIADVVEGGQVNIANAADMIAEIPGQILGSGQPPFDAAGPGEIALAFAQPEAAKVIAAAQGEELAVIGQANGALGPESETGFFQVGHQGALRKIG